MLKVPRLVVAFSTSFCIAGAIICMLLACSMELTPYPFLLVFGALLALCITPMCCYDEQGSDAGDVGWFLTGALGAGTIEAVIVLYRAEAVSEITLLLTVGSLCFTFVSFVLVYGFFCGACRRNQIELDEF